MKKIIQIIQKVKNLLEILNQLDKSGKIIVTTILLTILFLALFGMWSCSTATHLVISADSLVMDHANIQLVDSTHVKLK